MVRPLFYYKKQMAFGGLMDGYYSLGDDINKTKQRSLDTEQGVVSDMEDELRLDMDDEELIDLKSKWEKGWDEYNKEISQIQQENENYWKGTNSNAALNYKPTERPVSDNKIWQAVETLLPLASKNNPEPVVDGDGTDIGSEQADTMQKYLVHLASKSHMKLMLKSVLRNWVINLLGVAKKSWSYEQDEIITTSLRPQKLILDPDSTIDTNMEYTGNYIGELKKDTAEDMIAKFGKRQKAKEELQAQSGEPVEPENAERDLDDIEAFIRGECDDKLGTEIQYQEWWTNKYVFWTLKKKVLGKYKNPHWNYQGTPQMSVNELGEGQSMPTAPHNYFKKPKMPYIFLSVFNLGKHPHDDTTFITQNLSKQDVINKRERQIDKNVDWMNGGWAVSGERSGLTRDEAANAIDAARKGGGMWVPQGDVNAAIVRLTGEGLPPDVYQDTNDKRTSILDSFGLSGTDPAAVKTDPTVGGKIMVKTADGDRIGGGISEYLEVFSAQSFAWDIQMIYVYYTEAHKATIIGEAMAQESIQIDAESQTTDLTVTVKTGSLIPQDSLTQMNQAVDLATAGMIDPLTFFQKLKYADPKESAERFLMYKGALPAYVAKYFPDIAQYFQPPPPSDELPKQSISFKDLSPEAQVQMLGKVGITVTPEQQAIDKVASEALKHPREIPGVEKEINEFDKGQPKQLKTK